MNSIGSFLVAVGVFIIVGGCFNWNWFMEKNGKEKLFVRIMTRNGARLVYIFLGLLFVVVGVFSRVEVI